MWSWASLDAVHLWRDCEHERSTPGGKEELRPEDSDRAGT